VVGLPEDRRLPRHNSARATFGFILLAMNSDWKGSRAGSREAAPSEVDACFQACALRRKLVLNDHVRVWWRW